MEIFSLILLFRTLYSVELYLGPQDFQEALNYAAFLADEQVFEFAS